MLRVLLGVVLLVVFGGASAASKVALVIGNGAYQHVSALPNPGRDADAMSATLEKLGFAVSTVRDASRRNLGRKVLEFGRSADGADVALVFYAGHGMQVDGVNYLIPVDAELPDDLALQEEGYRLDDLLNAIATAKTRVVLLDACRDNPFSRSMKRSVATRSVGRGLARVQSASGGTLIAFATDPDNVAADGSGSNSPFTQALLSVLPTTGLEIRLAMGRVRSEVARLTARRQIPWVNESLFGELYLAGKGGPQSQNGSGAADASALDLAYWQGALALGTKSAFEDYLRKYPKGQFADQADMQIASLGSGPSGRRPQPTTRPQPEGLAGKIPGEVFRDCADCPAMVRLPTGSFLMGSNEGEADEKPVHTVNINYPLAVGKYEVTKGQFRAFVEATGRSVGECQYYDESAEDFKIDKGLYWLNVPEQQTDNFPVRCLNFDDARAYAQWLSRKTGNSYRLLSEAEWEYAARGGTRTTYPWGSDGDAHCAYANGADQTAKEKNSGWTVSNCRDGYASSAPIGSFRGNGYGLYDMMGNVWEWTQDCWNSSYSGAPADGSAWTAGDCARRVLRGGSWGYGLDVLRSADRGWGVASTRDVDNGFRLARTD